MSKVLAFVSPLSEYQDKYFCDVRVVKGSYRNNHFQEYYDKEYFKDCLYGATLALIKTDGVTAEFVEPTKESLADFKLNITFVINYNEVTKNVVTIDGEIYNLNDCLFTKYNKQTVLNMYNAIATCDNFHMQLMIQDGKIYDIGLYINKKPKDKNYNCVLHRGFVPASKDLLKRTINLSQEDIDTNKKLNQNEIDKMLEDLGLL